MHFMPVSSSSTWPPKQDFMSNSGDNGEDSRPLTQAVESTPLKTSSIDFLSAIQSILDQNHIDFIRSFRINIETTSDNNQRLVVVGETYRPGINGPGHVDFYLPWSGMPSPPDDFLRKSIAPALPSISSCSSEIFSATSPDWDMQNPTGYLERNPHCSLARLESACPSSSDFVSSSTRNISSEVLFLETNETHSLAPVLPDIINPMAADIQILSTLSPSTNVFDVDLGYDSPWVGSSICTNPVLDLDSATDFSSTTAPSRAGDLIPHAMFPSRDQPRKRARKLNCAHDISESMVESLSQNVLCEDFYSLLEAELPHWTKKGLRCEISQHPTGLHSPSASRTNARARAATTPPLSSYSKLEQAYIAVCQLNSRMIGDVVRNRIALIQLHVEFTETHQGRRDSSAGNRIESTVGRGHASHVIDLILENIHDGWRTLDQPKRAELRAKFHDRKKYGKRWAQLANSLGPGILLVCSTKLANAVRSAAANAKMLDAVIERVKVLDTDVAKILGLINPLAGCLVKNEHYDRFEPATILQQLHRYSRRSR